MSTYLVTGVAGFIGYHVAARMLEDGHTVIGVDNINDYYDVSLKRARLLQLTESDTFSFHESDVAESCSMEQLFEPHQFDAVVHLAAQAGVRHSLTHPHDYVNANLIGFLNVLEGCRHSQCPNLIYASSSSVYGSNTRMPFSVEHSADHPVSLYAATKKANELMAHSYSHLYGLPTTGLRFFTVYGPWGRPDMALFLFAKAILSGEPIKLFNHGNMRRSFTYIDDIVEPIARLLDLPAEANPVWSSDDPKPSSSAAPYRVLNIGGGESVELNRFVEIIEACLGKKAIRELLPLQPGDVLASDADVSALEKVTGFRPKTTIEAGIGEFCRWFLERYSDK